MYIYVSIYLIQAAKTDKTAHICKLTGVLDKSKILINKFIDAQIAEKYITNINSMTTICSEGSVP